jgi:hypothetical protein
LCAWLADPHTVLDIDRAVEQYGWAGPTKGVSGGRQLGALVARIAEYPASRNT